MRAGHGGNVGLLWTASALNSADASAYLVQGVGWGAMFIPHQPAAGLTLLAVMRVASGAVIALDTTILLAGVPERLRGRVTSLHMTTFSAVSRLALALFGGMLAIAGIRTVGVATGAASTAVGIIWWFRIGRRPRTLYLRELESAPPHAYVH